MYFYSLINPDNWFGLSTNKLFGNASNNLNFLQRRGTFQAAIKHSMYAKRQLVKWKSLVQS